MAAAEGGNEAEAQQMAQRLAEARAPEVAGEGGEGGEGATGTGPEGAQTGTQTEGAGEGAQTGTQTEGEGGTEPEAPEGGPGAEATGAPEAREGAEAGAGKQEPCYEKNINLPKNEAATCWWLSVNFALFHKQRKELDEYFSNNAEEPATIEEGTKELGQTLKQQFRNIYNFYSNQPTTITADSVSEYRKSADMQKAFNTNAFRVEGGKYQDAQEYIGKLFGFLQPSTGDKNELLTTIGQDKTTIYNIYISSLFYGLKVNAGEEKGKATIIQQTGKNYRIEQKQFVANKDTLILYIPRMEYEIRESGQDIVTAKDFSIPILETIRIPLEEGIVGHFKLDAMVCAVTGHYFAYIKCSKSTEWLYYGAGAGGKIKESFKDFKTMMETQKGKDDITQQATLLFYSRVPLYFIFDIDSTLLPHNKTTPVNPKLIAIIREALAQKAEAKGIPIELILYTNNDANRVTACKQAVHTALGITDGTDIFKASFDNSRSTKSSTDSDPMKQLKNLKLDTKIPNPFPADLSEEDYANVFFFDDNEKHKDGIGKELGSNFIQITPAFDGTTEDKTDYSRVARALGKTVEELFKTPSPASASGSP